MEQAKLNLLIDQLEAYARKRPVLYRLRVALLAVLGYGYLLAVVVILLLIAYLTVVGARFNAITIKVAWIPLVIAGLVVRSLWVTVPEPDGKELRPEQAPRLFDLVQEVKAAVTGPKAHRILLSDEFNASIVQIPRFGMFGWLQNHLVIGLPLLNALSPEEFRSVLAHEFGHLSGKHGRFSGWIYRVRMSWIQILTRVHQERSYASFIFEPFLNWYAPFFNAYSFVLARTQEYEADAYSVDLVGKDVAGRSLVSVATKHRSLQEEFWPGFFNQAGDEAQPPRDPFSQMLLGLDKATQRGKAEKWFLDELRLNTGHDDTHPALVDRLAAMGFPRDSLNETPVAELLVQGNIEKKESAAAYYLRELPEGLVNSYNRLWNEKIATQWRERYSYVQQARQRLTELEAKEKTEGLTVDERWERAVALGDISDPSASLPTLQQIIQERPDHVGANFALGALLLEQNDAAGIEYLEKASQLDLSSAGDACELISNFHRAHGRAHEAHIYYTRAEQHYEKHRKQLEQATTFSANDRFEPHDLRPDELSVLREKLQAARGLRRAYLVRKIVDDGPQLFYVLGVVASYTWRDGRSEKDYETLINQLSATVQFSELTVVTALEESQKFLEGIFSQIPGAEVFATSDPGLDEADEVRH